jgi:hypothetical protein
LAARPPGKENEKAAILAALQKGPLAFSEKEKLTASLRGE